MSTFIADFESTSAARKNLRAVFDAASRGKAVTIRRSLEVNAVVNAEMLRKQLARSIPPRARTLFEDERWVVLLADLPFVSEGLTVDEALADLILSLREYAEDWDATLRTAPNHAENWALVQLVNLSTDEQLSDWIEHSSE